MKYYFKHLFRVIRQKPFQPLLMLFILLFSFVVENASISCTDAINKEQSLSRLEENGSAVVTLAVGSDSPTRFLTEKSVTDILPNATVTGSYTLPFVKGEELVTGVALDFAKAGEFFTFSFVESAPVEELQKDQALFITKDFASSHSLKIGDSFTLSLFGKDYSYQVKGISNKPFLGTADVLCDISGIVQILTGESQFISLFAEGVNVYGKLYIKCENMTDTELRDALKEEFSAYTLTVIDKSEKNSFDRIFDGIALVLLLFTTIISLSVLIGCSYCLAKEREEFTTLFRLVGFSAKTCYFLRVLEMLLYSAVAVGLGLLVSFPIGNLFYQQMGLVFVDYSLSAKPVLLGVACLVVVSFVSPALATGKKKSHRVKKSFLPGLISLGVALLSLLLTILLPSQVKFYIGILPIIGVILAIAFLTEPILALIGSKARKKDSIPTRLAKKNCVQVGELTNSARLLAILLTAILLIALLVGATELSTDVYEVSINGAYVVVGGNNTVKEILSSLDEVEDVWTIRITEKCTKENGMIVRVWGVDSLEVIKYSFTNSTMPKVGEILVSHCMQQGYYLPLYQDFNLTFGDKTATYRISEVGDGVFPLLVTDLEGVEGTDYLIVSQKEGVSDTELYTAVTSALSTQMVSILPAKELMNANLKNCAKYITFCWIVLAMMIVFGLCGISNNLLESYRSRKEELNSFYIAGLNKKQVRKMLAKEYLIVLLLAVSVGLISFSLLTPVVHHMCLTFAADIFGIFKSAFIIF